MYILPFKSAFGCFKDVVVYLYCIWLFWCYLPFLRVDLAFFTYDFLATLVLGLPDAFCKNTGYFVNSARSKLCRTS